MSKIDFVQQATSPATPAASHVVLYGKTDDLMYYKDDGGSEHMFGIGPTAVGAGTATGTTGTLVMSNSGGISFGASTNTNGVTVTAQAGALSLWENVPFGGALVANAATGSSNAVNVSFQRVFVPQRITATRLDWLGHVTVAGSTAGSYTVSAAIYSLSKSTLSSQSSDSAAVTFNSGTNATAVSIYGAHSGTRWRSLALASWAISPGEYMMGLAMSFAGPAGTTMSVTAYGASSVSLNAAPGGGDNTSYFAHGMYSAGTGAYPASVHLSDINQTGTAVLRQPYVRLLGTF